MDVRLGDGIELTLPGGTAVSCDGRGRSADATVLSHAHGDHLSGAGEAVCSRLTAALAGVRQGGGRGALRRIEHPDVELLNAGHVAGSRAARVTDPDSGRTALYTGDVCTRDRWYLEGFDPPDADVLVIETTYGTPEYVFPDHDDLAAEIRDWLGETMDRPVVLFGYPLGRAGKLQRLVAESERDRLFVTEDIARIDRVIEEHRGIEFGARRFDGSTDLEPGDALVAPTGAGRGSPVASAVERTGAITAGFSGWALDGRYGFRRGYDATFPLSDHCDYAELLDVVAAVDPEVVYTHHGFADAFARHVTSELGIHAQSLKRNQSTLADL